MGTPVWNRTGVPTLRYYWRLLRNIASVVLPRKIILIGDGAVKEAERIVSGFSFRPKRCPRPSDVPRILVFCSRARDYAEGNREVGRSPGVYRRERRINIRYIDMPWHEAIRELVVPPVKDSPHWVPFVAGAVFLFADGDSARALRRFKLMKPLLGDGTLIVVPRIQEEAQAETVEMLGRLGYAGITLGAVAMMRREAERGRG